MTTQLDDFTRTFFKCALAEECKRFQAENAADLTTLFKTHVTGTIESRGGHLFWLTRNGHGAGFWDGDYPEAEGARLTQASKAYGEVDLYVGDDGQVWASGYEEGKRYGT